MTTSKHFIIFFSLIISILVAYSHDENTSFVEIKKFFLCFLTLMSTHIFTTLNEILSEIKKPKGE